MCVGYEAEVIQEAELRLGKKIKHKTTTRRQERGLDPQLKDKSTAKSTQKPIIDGSLQLSITDLSPAVLKTVSLNPKGE